MGSRLVWRDPQSNPPPGSQGWPQGSQEHTSPCLLPCAVLKEDMQKRYLQKAIPDTTYHRGMPERGVCQRAQSPKVCLVQRRCLGGRAALITAASESLSAPNPPWQRLVQVQKAAAALVCNAQAVCRSHRERAAAEGLAPCPPCRVFTGQRWTSSSRWE